MSFQRVFKDINELKETKLFKERLSCDINKGVVFPAIRNGYIDFYYKGGRLFKYDQKTGFETNIKYVSLIESEKNYIFENELCNVKKIENFTDQYDKVKELCEKFAGVEAKGVSSLYSKYSSISGEKFIVLDIEISFESLEENKEQERKKQDRIDILMYSIDKKSLKFVEAKHLSNSSLWAKGKKIPDIIEQLKKYNRHIEKRKEEILTQYKIYINNLNELFCLSIPEPQIVENNCGLYVFGFDRNQLEGRLKDMILENNNFRDIDYYPKGGPETIVAKNLWNGVVK